MMYKTNIIVLVNWNSTPRVYMLLHSDIILIPIFALIP
jgi:hypothetical protein